MPNYKIIKKSKHWHKHGKHQGVLDVVIVRNREHQQRADRKNAVRVKEMYPTVTEAVEAERRKHNA